MTNAEYQRVRRDAARSRKDCTTCCKAKATIGTRCSSCAERHRGYQQPHNEARLTARCAQFCTECLASGFHREGCPAQRLRGVAA